MIFEHSSRKTSSQFVYFSLNKYFSWLKVMFVVDSTRNNNGAGKTL